jgi:hypothetical protein
MLHSTLDSDDQEMQSGIQQNVALSTLYAWRQSAFQLERTRAQLRSLRRIRNCLLIR